VRFAFWSLEALGLLCGACVSTTSAPPPTKRVVSFRGDSDPIVVAPSSQGSRAGDTRPGAAPGSAPASAPASRPGEAPEAVQRHGPHVVVLPDGRVTKFFPVRADKGKDMGNLISRYAAIPASQIEIVAAVDTEEVRVAPFAQPGVPAKIAISDWVVVTGTPEEVDRAERFWNLYYAAVPQIEIEARIAEVTTSDLTDIGVKPTNPAVPVFSATGAGHFVQGLNSNFPNNSTTSEGLLSLSAVQSPIQFQATLELLAARRDVDIISSPRIAVRNGGRAEIVNGNDIPYAEITTVVGGVPTSTIKYKQAGIKLYVTPYLAGSDTILLSIEVESSLPLSIVEGSTTPITPVIATRSAKTDVHVRDGNTFVIGGLISTNNLEEVRKIPILGDIPILGLLFRSTLTQKSYTEVLFFITPRVLRDPASQGFIVPNPG